MRICVTYFALIWLKVLVLFWPQRLVLAIKRRYNRVGRGKPHLFNFVIYFTNYLGRLYPRCPREVCWRRRGWMTGQLTKMTRMKEERWTRRRTQCWRCPGSPGPLWSECDPYLQRCQMKLSAASQTRNKIPPNLSFHRQIFENQGF